MERNEHAEGSWQVFTLGGTVYSVISILIFTENFLGVGIGVTPRAVHRLGVFSRYLSLEYLL